MYESYESRTKREKRRAFVSTLLVVLAIVLGAAIVAYFFVAWGKVERPVAETDDVKEVSGVVDNHLAVYDGTSWNEQFWTGMDLGATLPGHAPGELAPTKEDYLRWFPQMKEMNVDVLRVYTILSPEFYQALKEFNSTREDPLWLIQGVWSPEEELTGEDEEGRNAYTPEITEIFDNEISDAVRVVHGDATLPERYGHASGKFDTDVSQYMLGWIVGTEWYPYAVKVTDDTNPGISPFSGEYFRAAEDATPFESWLAQRLETLSNEEMKYGWQHPVALANWPTTDPLTHPDEASEQEDMVSVDPMHVSPTSAWRAGYFASYHIYPAFPDFLRYDAKYQEHRNAAGEPDPYAGYLHELRAHHEGIPIMVTEYGTSSARGMAHRGALGRNQGMHMEEEQGRINADLLDDIHSEGYDGGILFSWQDEWFKFAWNTGELELPSERRPMWLNRLTNEQNYGVIAVEPGESTDETIQLDGETDDWDRRSGKVEGPGDLLDWVSNHIQGKSGEVSQREYQDLNLSVTHDEAYVYLLLQKREGDWDFSTEELDVGFGTLPDGSRMADKAPGITFSEGIQFLLQMKGEEDSHLWINSAYDQHTWHYGEQLPYISNAVIEEDPQAGVFLPWRLALNRPLVLPHSQRKIPFEDYEVGLMKPGITDPSDPNFDSLADWYVRGNVLEVRIPWTLLGYTDPSTLQVWDSPYKANEIKAVSSDGLLVFPVVRPQGTTESVNVEPLSYTWEGWEQPTYHERKKMSYEILSEAFKKHKEVEAPPER